MNQPEQAMHADGTVVAASGPGDPLGDGPQPATAGSSRWQRLDSGLSNVARIYDALLGGKDNYAADREAARRLVEAVPDAQRAARENRAFLGRAAHFLAGDAGIGQFLDIGTGLPTRGNVHEIARSVNPDAQVVYCDNDPVVMAHARALLADTPGVEAVEGDVRNPRHLLTLPVVRDLIDFSRPVAVLLVAVLHFVPDSESPWSAVRCITDHLAPGSYLVISHVTCDEIADDALRQAREIYSRALVQGAARSKDDICRFFDGTDLIEPGLVDVATWRSDRRRVSGRPVLFYAGVGRRKGRATVNQARGSTEGMPALLTNPDDDSQGTISGVHADLASVAERLSKGADRESVAGTTQ